ncbi:MAG: OmpA family protein [Alphaproteobacteria bacterium]|nr:OmpA family protein [Alphaproteobacteria bacterium]
MPILAAIVLAAVSGCSVPRVFGSDDSPLPLPPPLEAGEDGVVADKTGRHEDAEAGAAEDANTAGEKDGEYADLASVPEGEKATKAAEKGANAQTERDKLAKSLVADREQAKYTDEELRGGRVAAVAPPRPEPPAPDSPVQASEPAETEAPPAAPPVPKAHAPAPAPLASSAGAPAPAPVPARSSALPLTPQAPRASAPAQVQAAAAYSSTTFQPSRAQPLPADLAASLPPGVAQRYQETLRQTAAGIPSGVPLAPAAVGRGGPAYVSIPFASGSFSLSSNDRRIIAQVAQSARGGFSRIRVVGHASSTASSLSERERLLANWEVSQARATSVADELTRQGIDAAGIVIEAVGDSLPPHAVGVRDSEAAARRVDLFLE